MKVVEKKITTEVKFAYGKADPKAIRCQIDTDASCKVISRHQLERFVGNVFDFKVSVTKLKGFRGNMIPLIGVVMLRNKSREKKKSKGRFKWSRTSQGSVANATPMLKTYVVLGVCVKNTEAEEIVRGV